MSYYELTSFLILLSSYSFNLFHLNLCSFHIIFKFALIHLILLDCDLLIVLLFFYSVLKLSLATRSLFYESNCLTALIREALCKDTSTFHKIQILYAHIIVHILINLTLSKSELFCLSKKLLLFQLLRF